MPAVKKHAQLVHLSESFSKTQRSKLCHVVVLAHKTCIFYCTVGASALIEQLHTVTKEVENAASARGVV